MKSIAETVAFLVKPPTFDVMRLSETGMLDAKGPRRSIPTHLPHLSCFGNATIKITPTRAKVMTVIMVMIRLFLKYEAAKQMQPRAAI